MVTLAKDEICKVRKSVVHGGKPTGEYVWAIFKKANKQTARVQLITEKNHVHDGATWYTVPFDALWKQKAAARKAVHAKLHKKQPPPTRVKQQPVVDDEATRDHDDPTSLWGKPVRMNQTIQGLHCVVQASVVGSETLLMLVDGSVTDFTGDAIVNAANEGCLDGGGIDGRIGDLGGHRLFAARRDLPIVQGGGVRCPTGDAKLTESGDLPCKFVIHAVGPRFGYDDFEAGLQLLESAYKSALLCAQAKQLTEVAFCILSAGIYRGGCPLETVVETGIKAICKNTYPGLKRVFFCAFMPDEQATVAHIMAV